MSNQVYGYVTDRIVAELEKGNIPWRKSWQGLEFPTNFVSGKAYQGVNVWLLALQPMDSQYWLTFNQVKQLGGNIKAGSKSSMVVFYKSLEIEFDDTTGAGNLKKDTIPFLRYYRVFNAQDIEGIEFPAIERRDNNPIQACQEIVAGYPAPQVEIIHQGAQPCYNSNLDRIEIPEIGHFDTSTDYYSTLFHELTHSTGHKSRLNRELKNSFGSDLYAKEELVAELGAAFLCWSAGIGNDRLIKNDAAYIQNWLKALKNDKTLIVKAASKAQAAANYILNKVTASQPVAEPVAA